MKKILFKGCGTALATPFKDGKINFAEFEKLLNYQLKSGVNALIVCGTTGESSCMSLDEKKQAIKFVTDFANKKIPVIAGTGSNNTNEAVKLSKFAEESGVDGLLIVTPYYNKATQEGLIKHYKTISSSTSLPIILYNVPSRTGLNILPETCFKLSKIKNIVAIKEASGNISQVAKIKSLCKNNLEIYSGNDDQIVPVLSLGGIGVISVLSNIVPKEVCNITNSFFNGNINKASKLQIKYLPLIEQLFCEVNPIPVKAALNLIGYNFGSPRLPLTPLSSINEDYLKKELKKYRLIN